MSSPCCIHGHRSDTLAHSDALVDANAQLLSPAAHLAQIAWCLCIGTVGSWLVFIQTKNISTELQVISENRLCLAAHLHCISWYDVLQSPDLSWHIHHPCLLTSFFCTKWQQCFTFKFQRVVSLSMRTLTPSYLCLATKQLISEAAYREIVRTLLERRG